MLYDVDFATGIISIAVVMVCIAVAASDVKNSRLGLPVHASRKRYLLWAGAAVCAIAAAVIWNDSSTAPHGQVRGPIHVVQTVNYHGNREGMIACIDPCERPAVMLDLDPDATLAVYSHPTGTELDVGYLSERKEIFPNIYGFQVVDISDPATGTSYYHMDTSLHLLRIGMLVFDAILLMAVAWLHSRLTGTLPEADDEDEAAAEVDDDAETEPKARKPAPRAPYLDANPNYKDPAE